MRSRGGENRTLPPLVSVRDVAFAYPGAAAGGPRFALGELSFQVQRGEILGVIGPNSAGKTTLIRLLTRVMRPARGDIHFDGRPLADLSRAELARRVAVVPQETPAALPFTVEQLVLLGRYPHGPGRFFETPADLAVARAAMALTGVAGLASAPVASLSGGERQRVMLARALAQEPALLVLDEPTAHLDLRYQGECVALLRRVNREQGMTILLVSHDLDLAAEVADRLLLLAGGRVAALGAPGEVLQAGLLERVYGCPVVVERGATSGRLFVQVAWPAAARPAREGR